MRKALSIGVCFCLALVVLSTAAVSQEKPRIAVMEFENKAGVSWWYGTGAAAAQDVFVTNLVKTGKYRVVDRESMNAMIAEQNLSTSGRIDQATAIKVGKLVGAKYFLMGALTEWEHTQSSGSTGRFAGRIRGGKSKFSARMNARLIDTETGDILWADEAYADDKKFKISISGIGGGSDYSRNTVSTLIRPMVEELTQKLAASDF